MLLNRKAGALLACGLVVLSVAACSSSSSGEKSSDGKSQPANSSGSPAKGAPIRIGTLLPTDAPVASDPGELAAIRAAIATINSQGGVKGRPLQLDYCNESNDANKGAACARTIAASPDVATIGVISPFAGAAVTQTLTTAGIANVAYLALTPAEYAAKNNFPTISGGGFLHPAAVAGALKNDSSLKKVAVVANEGPQSAPIVDNIKKSIVNSGGTVAGTVLLPLTTIADFTPYAQKIIQTGAQVTVVSGSQAVAVGIIRAVHQLGSKMVFTSNSGVVTEAVVKQLGSLAEGIYLASTTPWIHDGASYPGINDFVASMKAEQARGDSDADLAKVDPFATLFWLNTLQLRDVLTSIVDSGKEITRASVLAAMGTAKDLKTYGVVKSPWTPTAYQTAIPGFENVSITEAYLLRVKDGKESLVTKDPIDVTQYLK